MRESIPIKWIIGYLCSKLKLPPYNLEQKSVHSRYHLHDYVLPLVAHGFDRSIYSVNCCNDKVTPQTSTAIAAHGAAYPMMRSTALTNFHLGEHIARVAGRWVLAAPEPLSMLP